MKLHDLTHARAQARRRDEATIRLFRIMAAEQAEAESAEAAVEHTVSLRTRVYTDRAMVWANCSGCSWSSHESCDAQALDATSHLLTERHMSWVRASQSELHRRAEARAERLRA